MYGKSDDLIPKLPPMSFGTITRSLLLRASRSDRASTGSSVIGPMKFAQIVSRPGGGLVVGDDPVRLDRRRAVPLPAQRLGDDEVGAGEGAVGVAVAERPVDDDVRADLLVQQRLRRVERVLDGDDGVERLVVGEDELGCVLGQVARLGGDRGDRLARVPRAVDGHRVEGELVRDPGRERLGQAGQLGAGERSRDAGRARARRRGRPSGCRRAPTASGRRRRGAGAQTGASSTNSRGRSAAGGPRGARRGCPTQRHGSILTRPSRRLRGSRR